MSIIGCDYHPRFQKIATLDKAKGKVKVMRLERETWEAKRFYPFCRRGR